MNKQRDLVKVRTSIDFMQAQILSHFEGFDSIIEEMVKSEVTEEKLYLQIKEEVGRTLKMKIGFALDEVVARAVKNSKILEGKIQARVNDIIKKAV